MRKLLLTLTAVAALVAATLGSTAPAAAQSISQGDGSVRFVRSDLTLMVNILPYVEQDSLLRIMSMPEGHAALGFGIGSILDGWGTVTWTSAPSRSPERTLRRGGP